MNCSSTKNTARTYNSTHENLITKEGFSDGVERYHDETLKDNDSNKSIASSFMSELFE